MRKEICLENGQNVIVTDQMEDLNKNEGTTGYDRKVAKIQMECFGYFVLGKERLNVISDTDVMSMVMDVVPARRKERQVMEFAKNVW